MTRRRTVDHCPPTEMPTEAVVQRTKPNLLDWVVVLILAVGVVLTVIGVIFAVLHGIEIVQR